ncbi:hypothetical protein GWI33_008370 [Rhynchophorus ferrugineus]|uniref:Uncharacterized protein n=1 Tax=Rhynchophorus ferrugineus TaxID=354439 RepID=A0A834IT64_RHYFE|nr:hypothetical protein GWI33_008370 [Rhynchophorus ferrugineus]
MEIKLFRNHNDLIPCFLFRLPPGPCNQRSMAGSRVIRPGLEGPPPAVFSNFVEDEATAEATASRRSGAFIDRRKVAAYRPPES